MTANGEDRVIEVQGLSRLFGDFRAVDNIDFYVRRGEIFGFLGANGAGKTTTIRILCGLLSPSAGKGYVLHYDIMTESEKLKPHVGYMSQRFALYPDLSVDENLDFYGGLYEIDKHRLQERKRWVLEMAGLVGKADRLTRNLSGGWKQRLALGVALLHKPELLFLDEPTAGVSPEARRDFWDLIHSLSQQGTTVFVTSHYMDEVEQCDRIVLMSRGTIAAQGTPDELKATAMKGQLVRFSCSASPEAVSQGLLATPAISEVQPFGAQYHAIVADIAGATGMDAESPVRIVEEAARSAGLLVNDLAPIKPSLEDVFISVISKVER